jgi:hypothetical protein
VYEGEWKGGKYHGRGKYTSGDSGGRALEYDGEWKADKMEGYGRYIYKDTGDLVRQPGERTPHLVCLVGALSSPRVEIR